MNKILIADDSKLVISLIKNIFQSDQNEYTLITAEDGKEALSKVHAENPDLILMDWEMPIMSGIEALVELKADENTRDIPVIMLTGSDNIAEAFDKGANDFVQKPFNKPELITRVKTALELVNATKELKTKSIEFDIQKDKLRNQKNQLMIQKKELVDSIVVAKIIQKLSYPSTSFLDQCIPHYFLLCQPKDELAHTALTSWDKGAYVYLCFSSNDARGVHAVLLNAACQLAASKIIELKSGDKLLNPGLILELLRKKLNEPAELGPDSTNSVEILIVQLDKEKKVIQYAGINKPFFIIKNGKIIEMKTDSIQGGLSDPSFKPINHKVQLTEKDIIYLVNDGFSHRHLSESSDYLSAELSKVFLKIFGKPMGKQNDLLIKTFDSWKKDLRQEDDIFVLGIKL